MLRSPVTCNLDRDGPNLKRLPPRVMPSTDSGFDVIIRRRIPVRQVRSPGSVREARNRGLTAMVRSQRVAGGREPAAHAAATASVIGACNLLGGDGGVLCLRPHPRRYATKQELTPTAHG